MKSAKSRDLLKFNSKKSTNKHVKPSLRNRTLELLITVQNVDGNDVSSKQYQIETQNKPNRFEHGGEIMGIKGKLMEVRMQDELLQ